MFKLDEEKVIDFIKKEGCKKVLLQLPDGLKIHSGDLIARLERKTGATFFVWFGSNFGACDLPVSVKALGVDVVVGFGHNTYMKTVEW
jgi:2-(3-amino-3-carboxypropyl)histidine synthase